MSSLKITAFSKQNLPPIRVAIEDALNQVREAYGITTDVGNCTFNEAEATFKLIVKVADTKIQEVEARKKFNIVCSLYNLRPQDFGTTVSIQGKLFTLVGINTKRSKYPLQMRGEDGKVTLYTEMLTERIRIATDKA